LATAKVEWRLGDKWRLGPEEEDWETREGCSAEDWEVADFLLTPRL